MSEDVDMPQPQEILIAGSAAPSSVSSNVRPMATGATPPSAADPTRADPALGKTLDHYRSPGALALGAYIVLLMLSLVHIIAAIWPTPVVSRDVVDTLEREERLRDGRRMELQALAHAHYMSPPGGISSDSVLAWRRDSASTWASAAEARRLAAYTQQLADSVRARRSREVVDRASVELFWGMVTLQGLSLDLRLILLTLAVGGLGAFVHCAQSFATYVGNRTLAPSWSWWYVLRPLIGAALAAIFYFTVRGALFPNTPSISSDINPFGIAAIGSLSGMFSKQAVDKLDELFRSLFRTETRPPAPVLTSIETPPPA